MLGLKLNHVSKRGHNAPHRWPFVRGIHRSLLNSHHKWPFCAERVSISLVLSKCPPTASGRRIPKQMGVWNILNVSQCWLTHLLATETVGTHCNCALRISVLTHLFAWWCYFVYSCRLQEGFVVHWLQSNKYLSIVLERCVTDWNNIYSYIIKMH